MEINNMLQANISSLREAIGMVTLRKAMNQDAQAVSMLMQGMQAASAKTMESSITPYKGGNIDISV